ncbi:MAG: ABC transporter permease [Candidatus Pacearchaeota archaeon]|nr:ABC transporter permease [Candidatus Pacearchaeota archaeon]
MLKDYFFLAFGNLRHRGLRSWLTILGIFIGIAAVVSLISLGQGLQGFIDDQFQQVGGDKILISPKVFAAPGSVTEQELILNKNDLEVVKKVNGVEDAEGALTRTGIVVNDKEQEIVMISGVNEKYLEIFGNIDSLQPIEGRQIKDTDKSKVVVGYNHVFGSLWDKKLRLGSKIEIKGKEFEIVGVLKKQGNSGDDNSVWMEKETFQGLFNTGNDEGTIVAKTEKGFNPDEVAADIEKALRKEKDQKEGQETFFVQSFSQLLETFTNIFAVVQAVFVGIAGISLIVGGIGIMNTMYTSVLERTREIGIMKAVGAKNQDIFLIFLIESGLLGLVGGAIGILLGVGIGKSVEYIATAQLGTTYLQAVFGLPLILGALFFSFIVGAASGVLPAMQAAKLKPADALRYE